ncbi:MAG TPA: phytanoyl-CoA dioxygenase family protein [Acidimicrobiales bacterium]|nr:phytanoyl-CoA dioxygenase family protein [Acidimicrobiales bacterium]
MTTSLTPQQQQFFQENGYLIGFPPIFTSDEMSSNNEKMSRLAALLAPGETFKDIREWHENSRWLFDIGMNPDILDLVEGVLGPDFYMWASNFFAKAPHTKETVGWHQDGYYWPMEPHHSVTVWIAFTEVDEENGAMKIVPGSHTSGVLEHQRCDPDETDSVLTLLLEKGTFKEDTAVSLCLHPGEVSLHDDRLVHGSPANPSDRPRIGLTFRYSGTDVKNDLSINPNFKAFLARGTDRYHYNPEGTPPTTEFGRPAFKAVSLEEAGRG